MKKSIPSLVAALALILCGFAGTSHAASIVNGAACSTAGASSTVKVKGVSKAYICKINPSVAGASAPTWTLKT